MKNINITKSFLIVAVAIFALTASVSGQGIFNRIKDKAKEEAAKKKEEAKQKAEQKVNQQTSQTSDTTSDGTTVSSNSTDLHWARIDLQVSWKEKGQTKYERRTYYSDIINADMRKINDERGNAFNYFKEGVIEQLEARGFEVKPETTDVYPTGNYDSRAEAETARNERMENDKGARAIYSYVWKLNAKNVTEADTQPKRVHADKPAPSIEGKTADISQARTEKANNAQKTDDDSADAQRDKKIWGFVAMTVQVRNKMGKQSSRVYVSEITELSDKLYKSKYNTDPTNFKPLISSYFKETVIAAAKERGEEVSEPDDYSLVGMTVKFSVGDYIKKDFYTTGYKYNAKSVLDAPYQEQINYAKDARRTVYYFRWDPSGKNVQADLEKEKARTSGELPN